jgi:hypothetical protein
MAYKSFPDFQTFWDFATQRALNYNDISHHPCCDVWSTRSSKRSRTSHTKETKWKTLLASLDSTVPDKKTALMARMVEEGWKVPVLLNRPCQARSLAYPDSRLPFRPHVPQHRLPLSVFAEDECHAHPSATDNSSTLYSPSHLPAINSLLTPGLRDCYLATPTRPPPSPAFSPTKQSSTPQ